jgi:hypothetical protein
LREVVYRETRPSLPAFMEFSSHNVAEIVLFSKSPHWSYERELRMLHNVKYADKTIIPEDGGDPIYLFDFPRETVKEVILGCQMPIPLRQDITGLVRSTYPSAKIFQAEKNKTEWNLDITELALPTR